MINQLAFAPLLPGQVVIAAASLVQLGLVMCLLNFPRPRP